MLNSLEKDDEDQKENKMELWSKCKKKQDSIACIGQIFQECDKSASSSLQEAIMGFTPSTNNTHGPSIPYTNNVCASSTPSSYIPNMGVIDAAKDLDWESKTDQVQLELSDPSGIHNRFITDFQRTIGNPSSRVAMKDGKYFHTGVFNDSKRNHRETNNALDTGGAAPKKKREDGIVSRVNQSLTQNNEVIAISPNGDEKENLKPNALPGGNDDDMKYRSTELASLEMIGEDFL